MPNSISPHSTSQAYLYNQTSGNRNPATRDQGSSSGVHRIRPGSNVTNINGNPTPLTPVNKTGFASAFMTSQSVYTAHQSQQGISPSYIRAVLNEYPRLAALAERDKQHILHSELNNQPREKSRITQASLQHFGRLSPTQGRNIVDALHIYQQDFGDNYLMNISAMGYRSLKQYLQSLDSKYNNENEVDRFVRDFSHHYDVGELTHDELELAKHHLERSLAPQVALLQQFIHAAPRISGISLLKGATGNDNPFSTQLNGQSTLEALLSGKALRFNGFLSTTSSAAAAVEFSSVTDERELGRARYTVDFTTRDLSAEALRRQALRELQHNRLDPQSIVFRFKAENVAGVSVDPIQDAYNRRMSLSGAGEQEILLNPGHYFEPEKIVVLENGFAVSGRLGYDRR